MEIAQAIKELEVLRDRMDAAAGDALDELVEHGLDTAQNLSSGSDIAGNLSQSDLNRMDNPYARRHGRPRLNPGMINMQRGVFYEAWRAAVVGTRGYVINDSDVADFLQYGTRFMFERPIGLLVETSMEQVAAGILAKHLERALP